MPKATVDTEATRYDLTTLPGGFVELRPLTFGQMLERREKASRMSMEQSGRGKQANQVVNFDLMQRWARQYEFQHCIQDHNLEDDNGKKLNFALPGTLDILNPKVGGEIERYIDELNQEEEDEDDESSPFTMPSTSASQDETPLTTSALD